MRTFTSTPTLLWILLIGMTFASVAFFEGHFLGTALSVVIVLISAIKSRLVILHYMEAKHASRQWRFLYETWNFTAAAIIIIGQHFVAKQ